MDIIICKIKYPNDPTNRLLAHQHFVGSFTADKLILYSISSIIGKEFKVYHRDGKVNPDYFILTMKDQIDCNLRVPSFIDCTKAYKLNLNDQVNIQMLSHRDIPEKIREKIYEKIEEVKMKGKHTEYSIRIEEFIRNNPKVNIT